MRERLMSEVILRVAIPVPLYQVFDYLAPQNTVMAKLQEKLRPGVRLRVPWGQREITGYFLGFGDSSVVVRHKLKPIISILDDESLIPDSLLALIQFASRYYHHPIGEVFDTAIPAKLRQGKKSDYRPGYTEEFEEIPEVPPVLNSDQDNAVNTVLENKNTFQPYLLNGVTGSGKTEVYLQLIEKMIAEKKQSLILVPEIGLTPQTVSRFEKRFLVNISVLHSGLTDRERQDSWMQARNGDVLVIIGTRSAIFTPLKNPGIIIIDEEHDLSFKQQEGLRYSARDLAVMRGQLENIPVVLGSATPSLESLYNVQTGRYRELILSKRAGSAVLPEYKLIDMKNQPKPSAKNFFSVGMIELIKRHLEKQGQVLIFLNRRGFAPILICSQCGWVANCKQCDAKLTLHQQPKSEYLQCHHCLTTRKVDKVCLDCHHSSLTVLGAGTQRLEDELNSLFEDTPIIRVDRDSTRKKGSFEAKLADIHSGKPCILVGTQMLAKGHHFPHVSLSVIVNIDSGLYSTDFRGLERAAQLILQVGGRAGRAEKQGEVVLQTYHPEHKLMNILLQKGYDGFAKEALKERKEAGFPPYQYLAMIRAESVDIDLSVKFLLEVKKQLQLPKVNLLGPIPAPMQKKSGKHRAQLLCQSSDRKSLSCALDNLITHSAELTLRSKVRWSIDVDPQEMI